MIEEARLREMLAATEGGGQRHIANCDPQTIASIITELLALRGKAEPYMWVIEHPAVFDPQNGGGPASTEFLSEPKPGAFPLYASPLPSAPAAVGVSADRAVNAASEWLHNWSQDLWATFESYVEAQTSGKHNGRRIDPANAKMFAGQFRERAEAVAGCVDGVAEAIRALLPVPSPVEGGGALGFKTEAKLTRSGPHLELSWTVRGVDLKARIYEPQMIELHGALADVLALAVEEGRRQAEIERLDRADHPTGGGEE